MRLLVGQSLADSLSENEILVVNLPSAGSTATFTRYVNSVAVETTSFSSGISIKGPYKDSSTFTALCTSGYVDASVIVFIGSHNIQYNRTDWTTATTTPLPTSNEFQWNTDADHGWNAGHFLAGSTPPPSTINNFEWNTDATHGWNAGYL